MKALGKRPQGTRLERIKASPLWAGDRFRNVHPIPPHLRDPNASMPTFRDFLYGGEREYLHGSVRILPVAEALAALPTIL